MRFVARKLDGRLTGAEMPARTAAPGTAVIVSVGLPLALIGLTEFHNALARRGSRAAPIVLMVRNYLVPVAGILVLISQPGAWQGGGTWPRVIWTVFGLLVIVVTINAINHLVFHRAEKGSWRDRFPTIFSDLIRFVFIILGIAAVFWWVWDADVAGVFAALGITSIVVGLALQNAVGSVVSGLFLVFEAPFELGDWIETGGTRGQIVEVNWRAIHLDTGNGIVVMPTMSQPSCWCMSDSAREENRGPLMTTSVPSATTSSADTRAASTATWRPLAQ